MSYQSQGSSHSYKDKENPYLRQNMSATKPWLILINPASGTKLAGKMFKNIVKPGLDSKQVTYEVMETEYAGETDFDPDSQKAVLLCIC